MDNKILELPAPYYMNKPTLNDNLVGFAVSVISKLWVNGSFISYKFLNGSNAQKIMFLQVLQEVEVYSNLFFAESNRNDSDVRVSFTRGVGSWSFVGTDANFQVAGEPTINLGWDDIGTYRHEIGHMIGLVHEQSNPFVKINWNKELIYKEVGSPPNNWSRKKVDQNFFKVLNRESINATRFDPDSVMIYSIPERYTTDGFSVIAKTDFSELDKFHLSQMYPKIRKDTSRSGEQIWSESPELLVNAEPYAAQFFNEYEEHIYVIEITQKGKYLFETTGYTNTHMELYGKNSATNMLRKDEDGALDKFGNSKIEMKLEEGIYLCQVRHFMYSAGGEYNIQVTSR